MARTGQSFYIQSQGPQDDALIEGVRWLHQRASQSGKPGLVAVSTQQNLDNIRWSKFGTLFQGLRKSKAVTIQGVDFELMTLRTKKWSWDGPALVVYGGQKLLDAIDSLSGHIDVLYIPWTGSDGDGWIATWNATRLGEDASQEQDPGSAISPVAEVALGRLTTLVNLSTGILHPSDHRHAVRTFETLIHKGERLDAELVRQYLVKHGWEPRHANEAKDIFEKLVDGRRPRDSEGGADEHLWSLWQASLLDQ